MVKITVFLALVAAVLCSTIAAQDSGFGLGIILGEPTGLSAKLWIGSSTAIDGAAAWSFGRRSTLHLHVDCLSHWFGVLKVERGRLPLYYGIGGRIRFNGDDQIGVRVPVGMDYFFAEAPLDIFFEIVPLLDLVPGTDFSLNGGIGIRYFFR